MIASYSQQISKPAGLGVCAFVRRGSLGIQVFQGSGLDSAVAHKDVYLGLLEANDSAKAVRRQLPFVDQSVERPWRETKCRSRLLRGEPVTVRGSHDNKGNTLSAPLSLSRTQVRSTVSGSGEVRR